MSKLLISDNGDGSKEYLFQCVACGNSHAFRVGGLSNRPRWQFDGNMESPTFSPSLRVMGEGGTTRCHVNVTAGKIVYHSDCPHAYAGKTVDMADYSPAEINVPDTVPETPPADLVVTPPPVCPECHGTGEVSFQSTEFATGIKACPTCRPGE